MSRYDSYGPPPSGRYSPRHFQDDRSHYALPAAHPAQNTYPDYHYPASERRAASPPPRSYPYGRYGGNPLPRYADDVPPRFVDMAGPRYAENAPSRYVDNPGSRRVDDSAPRYGGNYDSRYVDDSAPRPRSYDAPRAQPYGSSQRPSGPYEDHYDPFQPAATTYNPAAPQLRLPPNPPQRQPSHPLPPRQPPLSTSSNVTAPKPPMPLAPSAPPPVELTILTAPTTASVSGHTEAIYFLPPSHLPLTKYVSLNKDDALNLHDHLCISNATVWYTGSCSRAAEGWFAALEWDIKEKRSGKMTRGVVQSANSLEAELGSICKAAEGFQEELRLSIRKGTPIANELVVFCDSQAAIVSIDSSSHSEAVRFDQLWREICLEFLYAHMTLVWLPRDSHIEGHVLAQKISTTSAGNSYAKRRKERALPECYVRAGAGEPEDPASTVGGPWQRGDADSSRVRIPFDRPQPPAALEPPAMPVMPVMHAVPAPSAENEADIRLVDQALLSSANSATRASVGPAGEAEDEGIEPSEGAIFVTHFPPEASAKDIGVLFAQYGEIVAVDIFHISPSHPRFANVTFADPAAGRAAAQDLHQKKINLETPFAQENEEDLQSWKNWDGMLTVVPHEPPKIVPTSVESFFPDLAEWTKSKGVQQIAEGNDDGKSRQVERGQPEGDEGGQKRERTEDSPNDVAGGPANDTSSSPKTDSPRKRARLEIEQETTSTSLTSAAPITNSVVASGTDQASDLPYTDLSTDATSGSAKLEPSPVVTPVPPNVSAELPNLHTLRTDIQGSPLPALPALSILPVSLHDLPKSSPQRVPHPLPPTPSTATMLTNDDSTFPDHPRNEHSSHTPTAIDPAGTKDAPPECPIQVGVETIRLQIDTVLSSLINDDVHDWVKHASIVARSIEKVRLALEDDLAVIAECAEEERRYERLLGTRGHTPVKIDAFVAKVLHVLDGIAAAEEPVAADKPDDTRDNLLAKLGKLLEPFPPQTKEAMDHAARIIECLGRGKEIQEKKRISIERRVKVLEGMAKTGDVVSGVVRYLLTEA